MTTVHNVVIRLHFDHHCLFSCTKSSQLLSFEGGFGFRMVSERDIDLNITLCCPRHSSGQKLDGPVLVTSPRPYPTLPNHVLLKVDKFAFSANNITYQALGDDPHFRCVEIFQNSWLGALMCYSYFDFHPAPASDNGNVSPETHGLVPVWGFGTIIASTHPKIKEGERVYGYLAPTRYLLLPVALDVNKFSFYVPRPHLPAGELFKFVRNLFLVGLICVFRPQALQSNPSLQDRPSIYTYSYRRGLDNALPASLLDFLLV